MKQFEEYNVFNNINIEVATLKHKGWIQLFSQSKNTIKSLKMCINGAFLSSP